MRDGWIGRLLSSRASPDQSSVAGEKFDRDVPRNREGGRRVEGDDGGP